MLKQAFNVALLKSSPTDRVVNDPDSHNYWVNMLSGTSIRNVITVAAKVNPLSKKPWLNIQASVGLPSKQQSLDEKRKNVHNFFLVNLTKEIKALFKYYIEHDCLPWEHEKCQHAFPAQDHMNEIMNQDNLSESNPIY